MQKTKFYILLFIVCFTSQSFAQDFPSISLGDGKAFKKGNNVELEADQVEYSALDSKAKAQGHVTVKSGKEKLYCDSLELDRNTQEAKARGHVYLDSPQAQVDADEMQYNFNQQTGNFTNGRVFNDPFQIKGPQIEKISATHYGMNNGYMTTCDHDVPHFRLKAKRMDVHQGDKAVARKVTMYLGKVPVMYMPRYTQDLKNKPWLTIVPGKTKEFGFFLLTTIRHRINDNSKITFHIDYREKKDLATGFDYKYDTPRYGGGILKTYYTNERNIASKHLYQKRPSPTIERERFKVEWRHQWKIDDKTDALVQYHRVSDATFLKEYFERQHRQDSSLETYLLLTRVLPKGTVTFRADASRVNRFARGVERFPEIQYSLSGQEIGDSNFYLKTTDTFSNLTKKDHPTTYSQKTMRVDTDNEISYPMKVSFLEFTPYVGSKHTYYSRTSSLDDRDLIRGLFKTGSTTSTKFYRVWNYKKDVLGVKIDRLRHIVTPTVAYLYQHRPTMPSSNLNIFDSIDSLDKAHKFGLGLENKLQTKRNKNTVDLLRTLVSTDFAMKENPGKGGFGNVNSDIEFKPNDWLSLNADASYDHRIERFVTSNFEAYINGGEKWTLGLGRRFVYGGEDQVTAEWFYKINPKWKFKIYERFLINSATLKEEGYTITRDLHEWEVDLDYHTRRGGGSDFLVVFRLKAFPDMDLDLFSTGLNKRKTGSQSSEGL